MVTGKTRAIGTAIVPLLVSIVVACSVLNSPHARSEQVKASKLKVLLKERHTTLKEVADNLTNAYQRGQVPLRATQEAEQAVLRAEFDLCDTDKERVEVLEKIVELARKDEQAALNLFKSDQTPINAWLKAKANRLETEIALERLILH